tara:strand:+ start:2000 stop:2182 length:183 start_codon:yes stop_codon:yes gene_type:complete
MISRLIFAATIGPPLILTPARTENRPAQEKWKSDIAEFEMRDKKWTPAVNEQLRLAKVVD